MGAQSETWAHEMNGLCEVFFCTGSKGKVGSATRGSNRGERMEAVHVTRT